MRTRPTLPLLFPLLLIALVTVATSYGQLRRPGIITVKHEDRTTSRLQQEEGAIYLEGMLQEEFAVRVTKNAPAYSTLKADRLLGTVFANQNAVLLAVSDRAYRIRAKAKQGQIAGWVSKGAVEGLPEGFELTLKNYYERFQLVDQLIADQQVALGMTVEEVSASIGPPDRRSSRISAEGRVDTLEYISYERVPQTFVSYDINGVPVNSTRYIEVESGRVEIEFVDNVVSLINESEGIILSPEGVWATVPPPICLF